MISSERQEYIHRSIKGAYISRFLQHLLQKIYAIYVCQWAWTLREAGLTPYRQSRLWAIIRCAAMSHHGPKPGKALIA